MSAEHMKLAVCTLCIGEIAEEFSKYSFPAFKKYAQRIGADFIVFDTPKVNYFNIRMRYVELDSFGINLSTDRKPCKRNHSECS